MKILLTIDDTPSGKFKEKIRLLSESNIPAILFCRGDGMTRRLPEIVDAIKQGFIIGNHAFDHPRFSDCSLDKCIDQIVRTEALIDQAYASAGVERPCKLFRFPFGDRGRSNTYDQVQTFLRQNGFQSISTIMSQRIFNFNRAPETGTDSLWSFDVLEYKTLSEWGRNKTGLHNTKDVTDRLEDYIQQRRGSSATEVVLLHDFDRTHYMFADIIKTLATARLDFVDLKDHLPIHEATEEHVSANAISSRSHEQFPALRIAKASESKKKRAREDSTTSTILPTHKPDDSHKRFRQTL